MGYLANFMVYTFAMVGVIVVALLVFKNATNCGGASKSKYLKILDTMSLAPRKTLYIVSTGREKFLIAGDVDKTTLISKLETSEESFKETLESLPKSNYIDKSSIGIKSSILHTKGETSVMRNLVNKMKV